MVLAPTALWRAPLVALEDHSLKPQPFPPHALPHSVLVVGPSLLLSLRRLLPQWPAKSQDIFTAKLERRGHLSPTGRSS